MGFYSMIRSMDIFMTPVSVRYMESSVYKTFCGGALSVIALIMIVLFSSTEVWTFFRGNQYNESLVIENLGYNNT